MFLFKNRIEKEPKGKAYLLKRNLDLKLKNLTYSEASRLAEQFFSEIKPLVEELKAGRQKLMDCGQIQGQEASCHLLLQGLG